jgi:hypothetical protein
VAFIKLYPPEDGEALPVREVLERLRAEFEIVDADADEGQDHVAGMIAATLRFSDAIPGKQERVAWLQSVQGAAVFVSFGDDLGTLASCCVMPDSALFFDGRDELKGVARPIVERAAAALGYTLHEG